MLDRGLPISDWPPNFGTLTSGSLFSPLFPFSYPPRGMMGHDHGSFPPLPGGPWSGPVRVPMPPSNAVAPVGSMRGWDWGLVGVSPVARLEGNPGGGREGVPAGHEEEGCRYCGGWGSGRDEGVNSVSIFICMIGHFETLMLYFPEIKSPMPPPLPSDTLA